jgi:hypothetical protein
LRQMQVEHDGEARHRSARQRLFHFVQEHYGIRTKRVSLCSRGCPSEATYIYHVTKPELISLHGGQQPQFRRSLESLCQRSF